MENKIDSAVSNIYSQNKAQQKEFIKYLEDKIQKEQKKLNDLCDLYKIPKENNGSYNFVYSFIHEMEEILQKYEEIISDKDASNSRKVCKEIEWLETNLNKNGVYRFEMNGPLIDWFHKKSGNHLGTFYVDMIRKMVEKEGGDNK